VLSIPAFGEGDPVEAACHIDADGVIVIRAVPQSDPKAQLLDDASVDVAPISPSFQLLEQVLPITDSRRLGQSGLAGPSLLIPRL
jgi:hypothetical protein